MTNGWTAKHTGFQLSVEGITICSSSTFCCKKTPTQTPKNNFRYRSNLPKCLFSRQICADEMYVQGMIISAIQAQSINGLTKSLAIWPMNVVCFVESLVIQWLPMTLANSAAFRAAPSKDRRRVSLEQILLLLAITQCACATKPHASVHCSSCTSFALAVPDQAFVGLRSVCPVILNPSEKGVNRSLFQLSADMTEPAALSGAIVTGILRSRSRGPPICPPSCG
jgi:hypothetical protein